MTSCRLTPLAKALSFIFLRTLGTSTSAIDFVRLDQRAGGQKPGQLVAGKQHFVEMRYPRHAGILRVAQDRGAQFLRPTLALQFAHADERVFLQGWVPLIVEVVQQGSG